MSSDEEARERLRKSPVVLEIPSASGSVPLRPGSPAEIARAAREIFDLARRLADDALAATDFERGPQTSPPSLHRVRVTIGPDYSPVVRVVCVAPPGSECRRDCRRDCEGDPTCDHDFYDMGECSWSQWSENDDSFIEGLTDAFTIERDVVCEWDDGSVAWSVTDEEPLERTPARRSSRSAGEAAQHPLAERLAERCVADAGATCSARGLPTEEWCERCLAARALADLESTIARQGAALERVVALAESWGRLGARHSTFESEGRATEALRRVPGEERP